jgi:hypothetical protein
MLTIIEPAHTPWEHIAAPADSDSPADRTPDELWTVPEEIALFAEVDAILCEAEQVSSMRRTPAPPATGCALRGPRSAGRSWMREANRWHAPLHPVRAVQRGPPEAT